MYLFQTSMPSPESRIPESAPARLLLAPALTFEPGVPEAEFRKIFPQAFRVRAVDLYEAKKKNMGDDRTYWEFLDDFQYISPTWGPIIIPKGHYTDLASVPPKLHSVIDDDSPIMLYPSAPHDFLFEVRKPHGTRGWLPLDKQLTLTELNHVLTEAMQICGAGALVRDLVFAAVELANEPIRNQFRH